MIVDLEAQYRAVREACGLWRRPAASSIALTGDDRSRLLNGLVTCDVAALRPGRGTQGFFTDIKGHVLAEVVIRARDDLLLLELPGRLVDWIASHIQKYIVADRVEVGSPVEHEVITLLGPGSTERVAATLGDPGLGVEPWAHRQLDIDGVPVLIGYDAHFGIAAISLWSPAGTADDLTRRLVAGDDERSLPMVGTEVVEVVRIEEGVPRFGLDYDSENLPQESGLEGAVSYEKGCYLGQEVVARLHHRGQVARRVTLLRSESGAAPPVGCRLLFEGREAGTVTSVAVHPGGRRVSVLAMLQRRAFEPGTELAVPPEGGRLRVVPS